MIKSGGRQSAAFLRRRNIAALLAASDCFRLLYAPPFSGLAAASIFAAWPALHNAPPPAAACFPSFYILALLCRAALFSRQFFG